MADEIKLVRGNNRPYIKITLTDADGNAINLSAATTTVSVRFRSVTSETTLATLTTTKISNGTNGEVQFNFPGSTLDVPAGNYEFEIEVDFNGEKQTVYQTVKCLVREKFVTA
jgi:hypothetical protein